MFGARRAAWKHAGRVGLVLLLVSLVTVPAVAPPRGGPLPAGASAAGPVQQSGSAGGLLGAGDPRSVHDAAARTQPRPPGAVPAATAVLPVRVPAFGAEHATPSVSQRFDGPSLDPKATELTQDRTATTETFQNPDGSRTLRIHTEPHNARGADGAWYPIDPALVPAGPRLRPRNPGADVDFAATADDPAVARLSYGPGRVLAYGLDGAAAVRGRVDGGQVSYDGVLPGVGLRLGATPTGLAEQLVLDGPGAPASFTYTLRLTGLTPRLTATGSVELTDPAGRVTGVLPAGTMWDSAATPARSAGVRFGLEQRGPGVWALRMDVDPAWLHDPTRVYPVVVDPPAQPVVDAEDTYVAANSPGNHSGEPGLYAGKVNGVSSGLTGLTRSYLPLKGAARALDEKYIIGGTLNLKNIDATDRNAHPLNVYEVTQPWSTGMAWPGAAVGRLLGSGSFPGCGPGCPAPTFGQVKLDADALTDWTHGQALANGISLRAADETGGYGYEFESANNPVTNPDQRPFLDVRYAEYGATYTVQSLTLPNAKDAGSMDVLVVNRGAMPFDGGVHFGYTILQNGTVVGSRKDVAMPATVPSGGSAVLRNVQIPALTPGRYELDLTMWGPDGDFSVGDGVPVGKVDLDVGDVAPSSNYQQPASGSSVETLTPTLYAQGIDYDDWPGKGLKYLFRLCDNASLVDSKDFTCQESGWGGPSWAPARLFWGRTYYWGVKVDDTVKQTPCWVGPDYQPEADPANPKCVIVADSPHALRLATRVAQPEITSHLAGSPATTEAPGIDPQIGNYATDETDASLATAGPDLTIGRTYNSLDPRQDTAFGLGWASRVDMKLEDDGAGGRVLTYPSGRQLRFGRNPDDSYASPAGDSTQLVHTNDGTTSFTLRDNSGTRWLFDGSLRLAEIIDPAGLRQVLTYLSGGGHRVGTITNALTPTGPYRELTLTWTGEHVTSVSEPAPGPGEPAPTWTYGYDGDRLTSACAPGQAPNCTTYGYTAGSHYRSSVTDDNPVAYWRFDEQANATALASAVARHPGGEAATPHGVFTGAHPGPLQGTSDGAAAFDGTGYITLPSGLTTATMSPSAELWFRTTGSGTLLALQNKDFAPGAGPSDQTLSADPVLYVGTDGRLYGGYPVQPAGGDKQIVTPVTVNDGSWHHAVLSAAVSTQTLYLDGNPVGSINGLIDQKQLGAAVLGAGWAHGFPSTNDGDFYLAGGSIDEAAIYAHTLGALAVAEHHAAGMTSASELTTVTEPQDGRKHATLTYDDLTERVTKLVDHNGLTWTLDPLATDATQDTTDPAHPRWINAVRTAQLHGPPGYGDWTYTFDADAAGRLISRAHDKDHPQRFEYNAAGFLSATVDEDGDRFEQTTDPRGNVLSKTSCRQRDPLNPAACKTSDTSYYTYLAPSDSLDPRADKLASAADARSARPDDATFRTTYTYDTAGRPTGSTSPVPAGQNAAPVTTASYTTGTEAAVGGGTVPAGLPLRRTGPRPGAVTSYQYYRNGDLAETDDPAGLRTRQTYDPLGRVLTRTTLNAGGVAFGTTTFTYTPRSQVATSTGPAVTNPVTGKTHAEVTTYGYDGDGNVTSTTLSDTLPASSGGDRPRLTTMTYDAHDRLATRTDAGQGVLKYAYSDNALSTVTTDARGFVWTSLADGQGRLLSTAVAGTGVDPQDPKATSLVTEQRGYSPAGRLTASVDAMGRRTEYGYWDDGLLHRTTVKDVQGPGVPAHDVTTDEVDYDPAGHPAAETVAGGARTTTTYDPAGLPQLVTFDPDGLARTTAYTREADGQVSTVRRGGSAAPDQGASTTYGYDTAGRVLRQTDQVTANSTVEESYDLDERGLLRHLTDRRQLVTGYTYDATGAPVTTTRPSVTLWAGGTATPGFQGVITLGRNAFGEVTQTKDPAGGVTTTGRDDLGEAVTSTLPPYTPPGGGGPIVATTTTDYDKAGNAIRVTDPLGRQTGTTYDPFGRLLTSTAPPVGDAPSTTTRGYDRMGEATSVTTPGGARQEYTYDQLGRQITTTQVDRSSGSTLYYTAKTTYDDAGNARTVTTPMGEATGTEFNAAGEPLRVTDPTLRTTTYTHDDAGRVLSTTDPGGLTTTTGYDLLGRTVALSQSAAGKTLRTSTFVPDGNGNVTATTSAEGRRTAVGYDALNRPVSRTERVDDQHSITTSSGYDALDNLAHAVDGDGHATDYTSNSWGLPESTVEPATSAYPDLAGRTWTTTYDAAGQAVAATEPGGIVRTRTFDAQGRLALETGTGAEAATADRKLGYDPDGRPSSESGPQGDTTYHYDDRGNLLSYTGPVTAGSYTYNGDNELTARTDAAGATGFTYDTAGRLSTVDDPVTGRTMTYGYDAAGRVGAVSDDHTGQYTRRTLGYDDLGRVASDRITVVPEPGVPATTKFGRTYGYDLDDHLTGRTDVAGTTSAANAYGYDGAGRLANWSAPSGAVTTYGWDDAGNRTSAGSQTFTYDERNRLLSGGGSTHTYTARGTESSTTAGGQTTTATSDAFDRQVGHGQARYGYDSFDRMVSRNDAGYSYDGLSSGLVSGGGRVVDRLPDGTPFSDKAAGSTVPGKALFADRHGDVVARYLGAVVDGQTTYDPFGAVTATSGEKSVLGYQGDWTDPDTGQVDMAARWYSPAGGRFTARDSVDVPAAPSWAANKYAYANADPATDNDPTGHSTACLVRGAGGARNGFLAGEAIDPAGGGIPGGIGAGFGEFLACEIEEELEQNQGRFQPMPAPLVGGRKADWSFLHGHGSSGEDPGIPKGNCKYFVGGCRPGKGPDGPGGPPNGPRPAPPMPPPPPPPPHWLVELQRIITRPAPGSTTDPRPPKTDAENAQTQVFDPGPGITNKITERTFTDPSQDLAAAAAEQVQDYEQWWRSRAANPVPPGQDEEDEDGCQQDVVYGALDEAGRATGVDAHLCPSQTTPAPRLEWTFDPPGWPSRNPKDGNTYRYARGHLLSRELGGTQFANNVVTLYHASVNNSTMKSFENMVAADVYVHRQVVDYQVVPIYAGDGKPVAINLREQVGPGFCVAILIENTSQGAVHNGYGC